MFYQLKALQEVQLLLYFTTAIIGIELAIFFFNRYYKIRDERLHLNKILFAFGLFFLFSITGVFILAIGRFFFSELILKEIFYKSGYIIIFFSLIAFLYFITIEELSKVINLKITKILTIISFLPIIVIIFLEVTTVSFIFFSIIFISLILVYITYFQIKLINTSKGNIKKRLFQLFIGLILCYVSIFFIAEITTGLYTLEFIDIIFFIVVISLIAGFIITSLGVYRFPAFYGFFWEENLLKLCIINRNNNSCLYSRDFYDISELNDKAPQEGWDKLFSSGITGIEGIISAITNTKAEKINKIKQGDLFIFLEHGSDFSSHIIYSLVAKSDSNSNHYFLNLVRNQFEMFYKEILSEIDDLEVNEEELFRSFDVIIENILV